MSRASLLRTSFFAALVACSCLPAAADESAPRLERVGRYASGLEADAEIVATQVSTGRALLTLSKGHLVDVLDVTTPSAPKRLARHALPAHGDEELTCVSFHPSQDWFLAVMNNKDARTKGRLLAVDATKGTVLAEYATGYAPDAVAFSPDGRVAVVADEGEWTWRAEDGFHSMPGSITCVDLSAGPVGGKATTIALPDITGRTGVTSAACKRTVEREIDGKAEDVPLLGGVPEELEPENVAFSPDGTRAYVTLQENNAILVVDPREARIVDVWGLGTTTHATDATEDGKVDFSQQLVALREPDGLATSPDGRFVITADEGDTDPKASKTKAPFPTGGGRTVSVFRAADGTLVGDTGNGIDEGAVDCGTYDDTRSDSKGAEPEGIVAFASGGRTYAVVGLERAAALALIGLDAEGHPRVLGCYALGEGSKAPEGLALLERDGVVHVLVANEKSGDMTVFRFVN